MANVRLSVRVRTADRSTPGCWTYADCRHDAYGEEDVGCRGSIQVGVKHFARGGGAEGLQPQSTNYP